MPSDHFVILVNVSPVGDCDVSVDTIAISVLDSTSGISLLNFTFMSVQRCRLLGACDILYQKLSSAPGGILSDNLDTADLKYSLSVR